MGDDLVQLLEADVLGVLVEALPAQVQVVFPDQAVPANWLESDTRSSMRTSCTHPLLQALHFLEPAPNFLGLEYQMLS